MGIFTFFFYFQTDDIAGGSTMGKGKNKDVKIAKPVTVAVPKV